MTILNPDKKPQLEKFKEAAKIIVANESEAEFDTVLQQIADRRKAAEEVRHPQKKD